MTKLLYVKPLDSNKQEGKDYSVRKATAYKKLVKANCWDSELKTCRSKPECPILALRNIDDEDNHILKYKAMIDRGI